MKKNIKFDEYALLISKSRFHGKDVAQVITLLTNDNVDVKEIAALLSENPFLAGTVLKLINSGYYYLPHEITSINHAISLLGIKKVKELLFAVIMYEYINEYEEVSEDFRKKFFEFIFAYAIFSSEIARVKGLRNLDSFFSISLLRHIGVFFAKKLYPEKIQILEDGFDVIGDRFWEDERNLLGYSHLDITEYILTEWGLPEEFIQDAVSIDIFSSKSEILSYSEHFVLSVMKNLFEKEMPYFVHHWEEKLCLSMDIFNDVFELVLPQLKSFIERYELDISFYNNMEKAKDIITLQPNYFPKATLITMNKQLYRLELIEKFLDSVFEKNEHSNVIKRFIKSFNETFSFDRVFLFEKRNEMFVLSEFIGGKEFFNFYEKEIYIKVADKEKRFFTHKDKLLPSDFEQLLNGHYYLFPIVVSMDVKAFVIVENFIEKNELSESEIDDIVHFLKYASVIYLEYYYSEMIKAEKEAKTIKKIALSMSHKINTPLMVIMATYYQIKKKYNDDKSVDLPLGRLEKAIDEISTYLKELNFSSSFKVEEYLDGKEMISLKEKGENDEKENK